VGILPVLCALLGACAYLLRMYQDQVKSHTFTGSDTHAVRLVIAAIGGGVVGLFKNFTAGDGASISPRYAPECSEKPTALTQPRAGRKRAPGSLGGLLR